VRAQTSRPATGVTPMDKRTKMCIRDSFRVAAVLDWELCTIGDPIADFVWSLEYWSNGDDPVSFLSDPPTASEVFASREEVVDRYRSRCGFEVGDLSYYRVFSWWKQACIVEGALARQIGAARRGQTDKDPADTAVSYTHLDVYKRQEPRLSVRQRKSDIGVLPPIR